jgi:hypothetical protein
MENEVKEERDPFEAIREIEANQERDPLWYIMEMFNQCGESLISAQTLKLRFPRNRGGISYKE